MRQGGAAGQRATVTVAALLLGERNLSGALPMTVYRQDFPSRSNFTDPGRGARFLREEPAFRFGHALSYTMQLQRAGHAERVTPRTLRFSDSAAVAVQVSVTNTGSIAGSRAVLPRPRTERRTSRGRTGLWLVVFREVHNVSAGVSLRVGGPEGGTRRRRGTVGTHCARGSRRVRAAAPLSAPRTQPRPSPFR